MPQIVIFGVTQNRIASTLAFRRDKRAWCKRSRCNGVSLNEPMRGIGCFNCD